MNRQLNLSPPELAVNALGVAIFHAYLNGHISLVANEEVGHNILGAVNKAMENSKDIPLKAATNFLVTKIEKLSKE